MGAPVKRISLSFCHPAVVVYGGTARLKGIMSAYGIHFAVITEGETLHALLIDSRYSPSSVAAYIVELGGTIYTPPPPE